MATTTVKKTISAKGVDIRKNALDYMYKMSQYKWTPASDLDLTVINKSLFYNKGEIYTGMPYTVNKQKNLEHFCQFTDENNVYNGSVVKEECYGNHCTSSIMYAWKRVSPSVHYSWSIDMQPSFGNGIIALGDLKWDRNTKMTEDIVNSTPEQELFEAYALLKPADAILMTIKQTGHARMIHYPIEVVRTTEGEIDGELSTIVTVEQTSSMDKTVAPDIKTSWWVDHKYTFNQLKEKNYIPVTVPQFLEDEVEDINVKFYGMSPVQTYDGAFTGTIESNYNILAVKAQIKDEKGNTVCDFAAYPVKQIFKFAKEDWDSKTELEKGKKYFYSMKAEFAFGEPVSLAAFEFIY